MKKLLFVDQYGSFIGLQQRRIIIRHDTKIVESVSINSLSHIVVRGLGIGVSSNVIIICGRRNIPNVLSGCIKTPTLVTTEINSRTNDSETC